MSDNNGGSRPGAGRKPSSNKFTKLITIRATPEEVQKFKASNGTEFVRNFLASLPTPPKKNSPDGE